MTIKNEVGKISEFIKYINCKEVCNCKGVYVNYKGVCVNYKGVCVNCKIKGSELE